MYMLIDTGTANTWVMGADCSSGQCSTHTTFGAQDSDTLQTTNTKFNLTYGTGTVSGVIVNDTVKMAGFSIPLSFGSASVVSDDFSWYPIDGILGLGRKAPDTVGPPTVMEAIKTNQLFTRNLVGINLQRNGDGSTDGELNFGSPDITKYTGNLSYTNTVSDKKRWEIPIDDASVNGVACKFSGKTAIIDTGTTFIILPPADAQRFHDLIPDSQRTGESFNIPCSSSLPVQIVISNMFYNISAKDYVGSPVTDQSTCSSNIIGKTTFGPDQWLLGDVFLKNVYTVLDFDGDRIGPRSLPVRLINRLIRDRFWCQDHRSTTDGNEQSLDYHEFVSHGEPFLFTHCFASGITPFCDNNYSRCKTFKVASRTLTYVKRTLKLNVSVVIILNTTAITFSTC